MASLTVPHDQETRERILLERILIELRVLNRQAAGGFAATDDLDALRAEETAFVVSST